MTQYEKGMNVEIAYKPEALTNTLGEYVSKLGYTQLRIAETEKCIKNGQTTAVFTGRKRLDVGSEEESLKVSVKISEAITSIVARLSVQPSFIIAKGGITSSDVGTKGLSVKKATVMGQIKPGIPVWQTGAESKFPYMPYVIFPGNVGTPTTLREIVEELDNKTAQG